MLLRQWCRESSLPWGSAGTVVMSGVSLGLARVRSVPSIQDLRKKFKDKGFKMLRDQKTWAKLLEVGYVISAALSMGKEDVHKLFERKPFEFLDFIHIGLLVNCRFGIIRIGGSK